MVAPVHDSLGSVVNLARTMRASLDMARIETPVQTHTLKMLLDTIIDFGALPGHHRISEDARKSVSAMMMPKTLDTRGADGRNKHGSRL